MTPLSPGRGREQGPTIVWLHGEHDLATAAALSATLAQVIERNAADVVIDLSDVQFISGATIEVIESARRSLVARSRKLTLREPSHCAQRLVGICGLDSLVGSGSG